MVTYIVLDSSAIMLPKLGYGGKLIYSTLNTEMVQRRLQYPHLISRYDLDESHSGAPQLVLEPGDELFIVQPTPLSFLRWRVPVQVEHAALPSIITRRNFETIIDDSYAIALWRRGQSKLEDYDTIKAKFDEEVIELLKVAASANKRTIRQRSREVQEEYLDLCLEAADVLRYALLARYVAPEREDLFYKAKGLIESVAVLGVSDVMDVLLSKYERRAAGYLKNVEAERRDAAQFFPLGIDIYK